jgi:serine/threonine protein kinase
MLVGETPFADKNNRALFKKILYEDPSFSCEGKVIAVTSEAKDFIRQSLAKEPQDRIDPENIPLHPFFKDLRFDDIYKRKISAPYVPKIVYNSVI